MFPFIVVLLSFGTFVHPVFAGKYDAPAYKHRLQDAADSVKDLNELKPFGSDEEKLDHLLAIKELIPDLFTESVSTNLDLFELLKHESKLRKHLKKIPRYQELFREKKFFKLEITPPSGGLITGGPEIKPEAVKNWKSELHEILPKFQKIAQSEDFTGFSDYLNPGGFDDAGKISTRINQRVIEEIKSWNLDKKRLKSLLNLYNERSTEIDFLKKLQNFQVKLSEFSDSTEEQKRSLAQILIQGESELDHCLSQHQLAYLILLQDYLMEDHRDKFSLTRSNIDFLTAPDLKKLSTPEKIKNLVEKRFQTSSPEFKKIVSNGVQRKFNFYAQQVESKSIIETQPATLQEVTPGVGVFRGFVGHDCSTSTTFSTAYDPHERIFFVRTKKDSPWKAYVSSTDVLLEDGKKGLYINTINGRINEGTTELILRGLDASKKEFGVEQIMLPTYRSHLWDGAADNVFKRLSTGKSTVKIQFQDSDIRQNEILGLRSDNNLNKYDTPEEHREAVVFSSDHQKVTSNLTEISVQPLEPRKLQTIPTQELLELLVTLELKNNEMGEQKSKLAKGKRILAQILNHPSVQEKISVEKFERLMRTLKSCKNSDGNPTVIQMWQKEIQAILDTFGIESPNYMQSHPEFLYPGRLYCRDAFSAESIEATAQGLVQDFKNNGNSAIYFSESNPLVGPHWEKLQATKNFQGLIENLLGQLKDTKSGIRLDAMCKLGRLKPTALEAQHTITSLLEDPDSNIRYVTQQTLAEIKPSSLEIHRQLWSLLESKDKNAVESAVAVLQQLPPPAVEFDQSLIPLLLKYPLDRYIWNLLKAKRPRDPALLQTLISDLKTRPTGNFIPHYLALIKPSDPETLQAIYHAFRDFHLDDETKEILAPLIQDAFKKQEIRDALIPEQHRGSCKAYLDAVLNQQGSDLVHAITELNRFTDLHH